MFAPVFNQSRQRNHDRTNGNGRQYLTVIPSATTRQITGLSSWQMAMSSFHAPAVIDTPKYLGNVNSYSLVWGNAPFENLLRDTNPAVTDSATFYDANALTTASNQTFQRLTAQVALLNFMSLGNDTTVQVSYNIAEPRICVASGIFYIMEILLGVLAIFSVRLAFLMRKHGIPPVNPFTFRGLSVIIDTSPQMASLLRDTGLFSTKLLTQKLAHNYCRLAGARDQIKDSFAIDTHHVCVAPKPPS
ncbi:MAG: hypothetical protein Q9204_004292 [Flavoplaca sp. TL-2023a]